jgi:hypothetical protein
MGAVVMISLGVGAAGVTLAAVILLLVFKRASVRDPLTVAAPNRSAHLARRVVGVYVRRVDESDAPAIAVMTAIGEE